MGREFLQRCQAGVFQVREQVGIKDTERRLAFGPLQMCVRRAMGWVVPHAPVVGRLLLLLLTQSLQLALPLVVQEQEHDGGENKKQDSYEQQYSKQDPTSIFQTSIFQPVFRCERA